MPSRQRLRRNNAMQIQLVLKGLKQENKDFIDKEVNLFVNEANHFKADFLKKLDLSSDEILLGLRKHGHRLSDLEALVKERPTIRTVSEMIREYDKNVIEPRCTEIKVDIGELIIKFDDYKKGQAIFNNNV